MIRHLVFVLLLVGLSGCLSRPTTPQQDFAVEYPEYQEPVPVAGAIYHEARGFSLFDDVKAHNVGDILTVLLVEQTDASKSSSTSTSKETNVDNANPTLFGRPLTYGGTPMLQGSLDSANDFSGSGESTQSNSLAGSVSVTVAHRYSNGNLLIRGKKLITLNQGDEYVSVSGIVRPQDIDTNNAVRSDRIAESKISYSGKGPINDANRMGFLARFFNSPWSLL